MRVSRTLSLSALYQFISQRIRLDCNVWRIVSLSLVMNNAEIDCVSLLENNDTLRLQLESAMGYTKVK